ncbi:GNAT family N-acetyltransferase [Longibacter salinarum]|uniref:GNAT family N-acetyltransferase n=1 Tax=Longibacter salinarum TaxID=1850348 RepID=A0A2A8CTP1_9BACT|nr:GNAT family N-acetyltransferase [Longibacter salinarum]PEN11182.1 GNAT family N-acetyltransferase [Longibacter salinarum]
MSDLTVTVARPDEAAALRELSLKWLDLDANPFLLPRHLIEHFTETHPVAWRAGRRVGIVSGFLSQTRVAESYIRFIAVAPNERGQGVGGRLYERFFAVARRANRAVVRAITTPDNHASIAFHRALGFEIERQPDRIDGVDVSLDHAGPGEHRVLLKRRL